MSALVALLTLVLLAAVIGVISSPLLGVRGESQALNDAESAQLVELRTAREAKYRELRDLELDYRTGKLSGEDYEATGAALRAEALELLNKIEALEALDVDPEAKPTAS